MGVRLKVIKISKKVTETTFVNGHDMTFLKIEGQFNTLYPVIKYIKWWL